MLKREDIKRKLDVQDILFELKKELEKDKKITVKYDKNKITCRMEYLEEVEKELRKKIKKTGCDLDFKAKMMRNKICFENDISNERKLLVDFDIIDRKKSIVIFEIKEVIVARIKKKRKNT